MADKALSSTGKAYAISKDVVGRIDVSRRQEIAAKRGFTVAQALADCDDAIAETRKVGSYNAMVALMALRAKIAGYDSPHLEETINTNVHINLHEAIAEARARMSAYLPPQDAIDVESRPFDAFEGC